MYKVDGGGSLHVHGGVGVDGLLQTDPTHNPLCGQFLPKWAEARRQEIRRTPLVQPGAEAGGTSSYPLPLVSAC